MKCLILAAGYATRLYPLTENFPKPLLEVGGKTILDWLVEDIHSAGMADEFVVISNHKYAHHFENWAKTKALPIRVLDDGTESNETRLGAVKDIQFAIARLELEDDLLVIAGDNVLEFSLTRFVRYAKEKDTTCILRYWEESKKKLTRCGVVEVDGTDLVTGMEEKPAEPKSNWCCSPFYYFPQKDIHRVAEGIDAGCGTDAPGNYIVWLHRQVAVHAMEMPGRRFDVGDLESYRAIADSYRGITII